MKHIADSTLGPELMPEGSPISMRQIGHKDIGIKTRRHPDHGLQMAFSYWGKWQPFDREKGLRYLAKRQAEGTWNPGYQLPETTR
jgi:hypothetical protein